MFTLNSHAQTEIMSALLADFANVQRGPQRYVHGPRPGLAASAATRTQSARAVARGSLQTAASAAPSLSRERSTFKAKNFHLSLRVI